MAGYAAIIKVVAICALRMSQPTVDDRHALGRILVWSIGSVVATTALLLVPPFLSRTQSITSWLAAVMVIPQTVALGIPIGIVFGVALGLSTRPNMNVAKATLLGAVAASALNLAILAWAMPAANLAFREIAIEESRASGYGPVEFQKSYNEMWLSELRRQAEHFAADGEPRLARLFVFRFHFRFSFAAATLALVSVLLAAPIKNRGLRGVFALRCMFCVLDADVRRRSRQPTRLSDAAARRLAAERCAHRIRDRHRVFTCFSCPLWSEPGRRWAG